MGTNKFTVGELFGCGPTFTENFMWMIGRKCINVDAPDWFKEKYPTFIEINKIPKKYEYVASVIGDDNKVIEKFTYDCNIDLYDNFESIHKKYKNFTLKVSTTEITDEVNK